MSATVQSATTGSLADLVESLLERRSAANASFFGAEAGRIARLCHLMAERFARGGRLLALGTSSQARSDVRHVAVEFVHPVIVGKRALPAIGLGPEGGELCRQLELIACEPDVAIAFTGPERDTQALEALALARRRGCLTIAYEHGSGAEWEFAIPDQDPFVRQELTETHYHLLWELVHVFFEHRGLLARRERRALHDSGAASFLYPFLAEGESDAGAVLRDVRASVLMKANEIEALRRQTLSGNRDGLIAAARALRGCFERGGKLLALGNGGSATDAMDAVADFREPPAAAAGARAPWPRRPAIDLTEDAAILTAVANDVGVDAIFQRQVIAHGHHGDALLAFSTSGGSENVIAALSHARRLGLLTLAMVGYDGGRVAAEALADHVIVTRSQHIPRIQEAQASAYHALRALVEAAGEEG